jgi:hypothetical protein
MNVMLVLAVLAVALIVGCNGVYASKAYAPTLDGYAKVSAPLAATQPSVADARADLPIVDAKLQDLYKQSTIWLPVWLLDPSKGLLVTPAWYANLERLSNDAVDDTHRTLGDVNAQITDQTENRCVVNVNKEASRK